MDYVARVNQTTEARWPYTGTNGVCDPAKVASNGDGSAVKLSTGASSGHVNVGTYSVPKLKQVLGGEGRMGWGAEWGQTDRVAAARPVLGSS